jgi:hypothetical protein
MSEETKPKFSRERWEEFLADNRRCRVIPCYWDPQGDNPYETPQQAFELLKDRLPADAHLGEIGYVIEGDYIVLVVWSKTFDVTPHGEQFPVMNLPLQ